MSDPFERAKTVCIIKPDAFACRDSIIASLLSHGFTVIERRDRRLTRAQATRLYVHHYGLPYFNDLIQHMSSGDVCILLLAKESRGSSVMQPDDGCVAALRQLCGASDPGLAKQVNPDTIRARWGQSLRENAVHASKNAMEAERDEDVLFHRKKRNILLFGPPASGKGTQASLLVECYGCVHISTGDLLRENVRAGTDIGRLIKSHLDRGQLVPDALVTELTLNRLNQSDCQTHGWVLDGYPRTPTQAQSLIDAGMHVDRMVVLSADYEELVRRVAGRRFDPKTGATYHLKYNPPPPGIVSQRVIQRSDDRESVMRQRLATYDATVAGVVRQFADVAVIGSSSSGSGSGSGSGGASTGIYDLFVQMVRAIDIPGTRRNVAIRSKSANTRRRLTARL